MVLMGLWHRDAASAEAVMLMALDTPLSRVDNTNITFFFFFKLDIDLSTEDKIQISHMVCFLQCYKCNVIGLETCCNMLLRWEKVSVGFTQSVKILKQYLPTAKSIKLYHTKTNKKCFTN